ncbi:P63C domain-containing protein [Aliiroseovarius sediminis]|uniref:P63C domain-containing protein n=1 Tax=Aliiroseovarius sediminis TaxID=2925839 RepID=UPI001F58C061|nr:P63C domain-containing protein [Aliiroseovarius sediminis]MCI2394099.1 P63C domain-containing protein [Aliiroseovarius sediminis]
MSEMISKKAEFSGELELGDVKLSCFVTADGERYISGRSITAAIGMKGRGPGVSRISSSSTLGPYLNNSLRIALTEPAQITGKTPIAVHGYRAEILADVCDALLEARKDGALVSEQEQRYGQYAEMLVRGFARVGIAALVDEATGYQEVRERKALQKILDKFLKDEARTWSKTFPDEFWEKLVRVKGYDSYLALKRPAFIGHWVNDIVYDRLAPGIKQKLRDVNPRSEGGSRRRKHHQHFTEDYGLPELKDHLKKVMVLMDASSNKREFERLLDRSLPKYGATIEMALDDEN